MMPRPLAALAALCLAAAPAAAQPPLPVDLARRAAGADSLAIRLQGREVGHQRSTFGPTAGGGWRHTETTVMTGRMEQTTTVELGPDGTMRAVVQRGTAGGQPMATNLTYQDGRVRGRSSNPAPDGTTRAFDIDSAVGAVVDDNALQALVPALPLAEGAGWSATMFSSGQNRLVPITLTVAAREAVEVPAGRFDTWRVEVSGAAAPLAFSITAAAPRRVVRVQVIGAPFEFVLAQ
jgi:hypothetical protein